MNLFQTYSPSSPPDRPLRKSLRPGAATPYICRYFRRRSDDSGGTSPYSVFHSPMIVVKFRLFALAFRRPCCSLSASPAPGCAATIRGAAVATLELKPPDESWIMSSSSSRGFSDTSHGRTEGCEWTQCSIGIGRAERVERRQRPLLVARFMAPEASTRRVHLVANPRDVVSHFPLADRAVTDFLDLVPDRRRAKLRELLVDNFHCRRDVLAEDVVVDDQRRGARQRRRGDEEGERPHPCRRVR